MIIDNFEQISTLLEFSSEDDFYFAQIIQRKKDNPETTGTNNSARLIKPYYIKSLEHLNKVKEEMILLSEHYNARVCINLNKRSFERTAFHTLKKITDQILNKDYKSVRRAYNSACGEYSNGDKRWIIDIDDINVNALEIKEYIYNQQPIGDKYIATIPTKHGYHLIVKPFNLSHWSMIYTHDIHKNNPTILYYNSRD
jgi:hypothetical protein